MRNINYFIFLVIIILINCCQNYPPLNEYQVVGFVPIEPISNGRLFILDNELVVICISQDVSAKDELRKYDLSIPTNPELIDKIKLTKSFPEPLLPQYNKSLIFSIDNLNIIKVLDIYNGSVFDINLNFRPLTIASKDSFMFVLADSCLSSWNIANFSNPVMVFRDSIPTCFTGGLLGINDTLMFGIFNNDSFKLWNIKLPSQPKLIVSGTLEYKSPNKIIINDRNIFISHNFQQIMSFINHLIITDSGAISLKETEYTETIADFLFNRDTIFIITHQFSYPYKKYKFLVRDAINLSYLLNEVSLPELIINPNFTIYNNHIYLFARNKGIFIYKKMEE